MNRVVDAIVLAAGASTRMGQGRQKLLLEVDGRPMVRRVVETIAESSLNNIHVVTGEHHAIIGEILQDMERIQLVRNPDPKRGMLSSVRCGLHAIDSDTAQGVAVFLGDQPRLSRSTIEAVLSAWIHSSHSIALPTHGERRGHPLMFDLRHRAAVLTQFDDVGLRGLLTACPGEILEVPTESPEVLEDIDTPEDYKATTKKRPPHA